MTKIKFRATASTLFATLVLVLLSLTVFSQQEDCVFDQSTQSSDFIKHIPEFSNFTWDDSTKTATINLEDGNVLIAQRGGCVHFGLSGTLILESEEETHDLQAYLDKAKWIAKRLFHESDYRILTNSLETKSYDDYSENGSVYLVIPHESYDEFIISIDKNITKTTIYVGYYFS